MVQTEYVNNGLAVTFGPGNIKPVDPMFAAPEAGEFHLKSVAGRWSRTGYVSDPVASPLLALHKARPTRIRNALANATNLARTATAAKHLTCAEESAALPAGRARRGRNRFRPSWRSSFAPRRSAQMLLPAAACHRGNVGK